jgi:hypothetical protein
MVRRVVSVPLDGQAHEELRDAARACGVTVAAYLREAGLAVAAAQKSGGAARCRHMSAYGVTSASCDVCGPLPAAYVLAGRRFSSTTGSAGAC